MLLLLHLDMLLFGIRAVPHDAAVIGAVSGALCGNTQQARLRIQAELRLHLRKLGVAQHLGGKAEARRAALAGNNARVAVQRTGENAHAVGGHIIRHGYIILRAAREHFPADAARFAAGQPSHDGAQIAADAVQPAVRKMQSAFSGSTTVITGGAPR